MLIFEILIFISGIVIGFGMRPRPRETKVIPSSEVVRVVANRRSYADWQTTKYRTRPR